MFEQYKAYFESRSLCILFTHIDYTFIHYTIYTLYICADSPSMHLWYILHPNVLRQLSYLIVLVNIQLKFVHSILDHSVLCIYALYICADSPSIHLGDTVKPNALFKVSYLIIFIHIQAVSAASTHSIDGIG